MRAILLLLMVTAACGSKGDQPFELDIGVDAPGAASAVVDGRTLPPVGGLYSKPFASLSDATGAHGTVETLGADGGVRAMASYELGNYCTAAMPLLRETQHFVESDDGSGNLSLVLDSIDCEKTDGTGTTVKP